MPGPQPLPTWVLHKVPSGTSPFNFQYPLFSCRSSSSCCFRRHFLRKLWPVQLPFRLFIVCGIFLSSLSLCNLHFSHHHPTDLLQYHVLKFSRYFWSVFLNCPKFQHRTQPYSKCNTVSFFPKFKSSLLVKRILILLNAAFTMEIMDLISWIHFALFAKNYMYGLNLLWSLLYMCNSSAQNWSSANFGNVIPRTEVNKTLIVWIRKTN